MSLLSLVATAGLFVASLMLSLVFVCVRGLVAEGSEDVEEEVEEGGVADEDGDDESFVSCRCG
jgi:hypothetical protein